MLLPLIAMRMPTLIVVTMRVFDVMMMLLLMLQLLIGSVLVNHALMLIMLWVMCVCVRVVALRIAGDNVSGACNTAIISCKHYVCCDLLFVMLLMPLTLLFVMSMSRRADVEIWIVIDWV